MIAKRAQERILFKTSPKWLSIKSANTPSQTRVPSTATATTAAARTSVPRDEQRTNHNHPSIKIQSTKQQNHKPMVGGEKKKNG